MTPVHFPEANARFQHPDDLDESQCFTIDAYAGSVRGGSIDGAQITVTAWRPTMDELQAIIAGKPIFLSFIGGLPPHYPSMSFQEATHPA